MKRLAFLLPLLLMIAWNWIPSAPIQQDSTSTPKPTLYVPPTVTSYPTDYRPPLFPTSSGDYLTPDYARQCPYQGTPIGYGTVTPDPLWLMMCGRCMPTGTVWPTITFPTQVPTNTPQITGTPATPTQTATSTITATSTPSGNNCGVIDNNAILANMWGQASAFDSYYDGLYTGTGTGGPSNQWALTTTFYPGQSTTVHYMVKFLGGSVTYQDTYWLSHCVNSLTVGFEDAISCGMLAPIATVNSSHCDQIDSVTFDCTVNQLGGFYLRFHLGGASGKTATWTGVHVQIARTTDCMRPDGTPTPSAEGSECASLYGTQSGNLTIPAIFIVSPDASCFSTPWVSVWDTSPMLQFISSVLTFLNVHTEFFDSPDSWIYVSLPAQTFCFRTVTFSTVSVFGLDVALSTFFTIPLIAYILSHLTHK